MEDPKLRGKSALHWENAQARSVCATPDGLLLAELIKEFLDFYKLDYSKQIFMPETNLSTHQSRDSSQVANDAGLDSSNLN